LTFAACWTEGIIPILNKETREDVVETERLIPQYKDLKKGKKNNDHCLGL